MIGKQTAIRAFTVAMEINSRSYRERVPHRHVGDTPGPQPLQKILSAFLRFGSLAKYHTW
jgi:hypothetical protein